MPSNKRKLIVRSETLPYLQLFDLNRVWLNKKQERMKIAEEFRELKSRAWIITHSITEIEEKISQAIVKLEKKQ